MIRVVKINIGNYTEGEGAKLGFVIVHTHHQWKWTLGEQRLEVEKGMHRVDIIQHPDERNPLRIQSG